jgi:hypothetical protein
MGRSRVLVTAAEYHSLGSFNKEIGSWKILPITKGILN